MSISVALWFDRVSVWCFTYRTIFFCHITTNSRECVCNAPGRISTFLWSRNDLRKASKPVHTNYIRFHMVRINQSDFSSLLNFLLPKALVVSRLTLYQLCHVYPGQYAFPLEIKTIYQRWQPKCDRQVGVYERLQSKLVQLRTRLWTIHFLAWYTMPILISLSRLAASCVSFTTGNTWSPLFVWLRPIFLPYGLSKFVLTGRPGICLTITNPYRLCWLAAGIQFSVSSHRFTTIQGPLSWSIFSAK